MTSEAYTFIEKPGQGTGPVFVLLHGTGGDEHQFMGLGHQLLPQAHLVGVRGDVSEYGALRYFRRTGEGVYDMADLARATDKLDTFLRELKERLPGRPIYALGYSNGANILASVLFKAPERVDRAVLMHPLIPFTPEDQPGLAGRAVLITAGRADPICPAPETQKLGDWFGAQGAKTEIVWHAGGHEVRPEELQAVQRFVTAS
ncbi:alpha/beta hydrolase [Arsenicitalea aurantiaca]|uniref:Alpha/beta hydrolase n=1 Tax=Arsenicitalea aurantiaca TaxID=1783274 RepID=A0A433XK04_9HYPH|nr:alpha/beta hydrolase [Arsenicitalea aurantiaca]RUT34417.1 alpha/beta hydrolase [Arsenicitalea aurantiaca]